jgi:hypothetical protein
MIASGLWFTCIPRVLLSRLRLCIYKKQELWRRQHELTAERFGRFRDETWTECYSICTGRGSLQERNFHWDDITAKSSEGERDKTMRVRWRAIIAADFTSLGCGSRRREVKIFSRQRRTMRAGESTTRDGRTVNSSSRTGWWLVRTPPPHPFVREWNWKRFSLWDQSGNIWPCMHA